MPQGALRVTPRRAAYPGLWVVCCLCGSETGGTPRPASHPERRLHRDEVRAGISAFPLPARRWRCAHSAGARGAEVSLMQQPLGTKRSGPGLPPSAREREFSVSLAPNDLSKDQMKRLSLFFILLKSEKVGNNA